MKIDEKKVNEHTLALMYLTTMVGKESRSCSIGYDSDTLDKLRENGLIAEVKPNAKVVTFTEEGARQSEELFKEIFTIEE